jgi:flagellar assembly protein FliH
METQVKAERKVERFAFMDFGDGSTSSGFRKSGKTKEEAPPPPPTFNEEQLKAAEKAAYQKGFLAGEQEGRRQAESEQSMVDRKLTACVEEFAKRVHPLFEDYRKSATGIQENLPKISLAIARKVAGQSLAENAQAVIDTMALAALESMMKEPKLTITVHESLADTLTRKVEKIAEDLQSEADIVILRDPNMPLSDFRIEWNQGVMERQTEALWQQVGKVIEDMSATAVRDTKAQMEALGDEVNANPDSAQPPAGSQDSLKKE